MSKQTATGRWVHKEDGRLFHGFSYQINSGSTHVAVIAVLPPGTLIPTAGHDDPTAVDIVCVAQHDGTLRYVGRGTVNTTADTPQVDVTKSKDGESEQRVMRFKINDRILHTAQLIWRGEVWDDLPMLVPVSLETAAKVHTTPHGEPVPGWSDEEASICRLMHLTHIERAAADPSRTGLCYFAELAGEAFVIERAREQAQSKALTSKRLPLEANQVNALTIRHRDFETRRELTQQRGLRIEKSIDANSRQRITVTLKRGCSGGMSGQLSMFVTQGNSADLGMLALDELTRNRDAGSARRVLALIATLAENPGGVDWDENGKRRLRLDAMDLMGQPAKSASKAQADAMRREIERLKDEQIIVSVAAGKRKPDRQYPILTIVGTDVTTGKAATVALNPVIVDRMTGKGRGVWMPRSVFELSDNDGGYTFALAWRLISRWQLGASRGWESLEKTLDGARMLEAFNHRVVTHGRAEARRWVEEIILLLRAREDVGGVRVDWARGRVMYEKPPRWLTEKQPRTQQPTALPLLEVGRGASATPHSL